MAKQSAGLLLHRQRQNALEVFLVHPGGPFWKSKDDGAWFDRTTAMEKALKGQVPILESLYAQL